MDRYHAVMAGMRIISIKFLNISIISTEIIITVILLIGNFFSFNPKYK